MFVLINVARSTYNVFFLSPNLVPLDVAAVLFTLSSAMRFSWSTRRELPNTADTLPAAPRLPFSLFAGVNRRGSEASLTSV